MDPAQAPRQTSAMTPLTVAAFAVHVFTACGAACALLALIAAPCATDWPTDVLVARRCADHRRRRRHFCAAPAGRRSACRAGRATCSILSSISSITCSCRPMRSLPAGCCRASLAMPLGALIVVTGSLYFADRRMKTADYYFRGFPAIWNVAAFYLFLLKPPPWLGALVVVALAALTFVPIPFRSSDPHCAFARAHDGGAGSLGVARDRSRWWRT